MLNKFLREWYVLNKSQRRGTVVLLILLLCALIFKLFYSSEVDDKVIYFANIHVQNREDSSFTKRNQNNFHKDSLFLFDPNTASESELRALGLPEKVIKNIIHYRNAGGRFYNAESLKKLYSMNDSLYNIIAPYILITTNFTGKQKENSTKELLPQHYKKVLISTELNTADSSQLEKLKGIGKILAARIFKYKTRLGGFYSIEQLKEVYGISDSLYQYIITNNKITVDTGLIKKINIHTVEFKTLIRHPYLNYNKDLVIKILKAQKQGLSEKQLVEILGEERWSRLKHYIEY